MVRKYRDYVRKWGLLAVLILGLGCSREEKPGAGYQPSEPGLARLVADYGDGIDSTLKHLPEIEKRMAEGARSPLHAVELILGKTPEPLQGIFLGRLESVLQAREKLVRECADLSGGVYAVASSLPELRVVADEALAKTGMDSSAMTPGEVSAAMTADQSGAMIAAVARVVSEFDDASKAELQETIRSLGTEASSQ